MIVLCGGVPVQVGDNLGNKVGFSGKYYLAVGLVEEQRSTKGFCFSDVALQDHMVADDLVWKRWKMMTSPFYHLHSILIICSHYL